MMMDEFIERTGFVPTAEEYAEIEESKTITDGLPSPGLRGQKGL